MNTSTRVELLSQANPRTPRERACYNCGFPDAQFLARVRLRAENQYRSDAYRTLAFCDEECARQTMFLQLETRSTSEAVTRLLAGKATRYSEFSRQVAVDRVEGRSDRYETPSQVADSAGSKMPKNVFLGLPHREGVSSRSEGLLERPATHVVGRPKKWADARDRQRAYRDRKRGGGGLVI